jgi:5'-3' exonuclease
MNKYAHLLANIKEDSEEIKSQPNDRVLIIDSMNMFLRNFSVINKINPSGHHIGGLVGYLRSLAFMIKQHNPTRVLLIFDGEGNTVNKKYIYPEYKGNRKIKRITNWTSFDSLQEESESIQTQLLRLIDYLKFLPINISVIDKLEADDIIAYLAPKFGQSIIVSADQDFLQLVCDQITVYSPIKKKYYTSLDVFEEFGCWPINFLGKKILMGDASDNVPKVPKLGPKKLYSLFPELTTTNHFSLKEIIDKSYKESDNIPLYGDVYNFRKQLEINELLMDLENPNIPEQEKERLDNLILEKPYKMNKAKFLSLVEQDKLGNSISNDVNFWLSDSFGYLEKIK